LAIAMSSWVVVTASIGCTGTGMEDGSRRSTTTSGAGGSGTTGSGGSGTTGGGSGDWCRALTVFQDNCQKCHGTTPLYGAPMPLVTIDDLRAPSKTEPSRPVYQMVSARIHDDQKPMPPASTGDRLTTDELAAIDAWIAAGATGSSCGGPTTGAGTSSGTSGTAAGTGGSTGAGGAGGAGMGGAGGTGPTGDWPADCEQRYKLVAHGQSKPNDPTKFNVSGAPTKQFYECFFFKAPYGTDVVQALAFRPIIDDARVIHHWILYGTDTSSATDGQVGGSGCSSGAFVAGWAPGGTGADFPADVGLEMPKGTTAFFGLEIHYNNNANYTDALDASGVEFCTTKKFRTHTAAVHWLGSNSILIAPHATQDVVGQCDPTSTQAIHILGVSPHMHQTGVHAKLVLNRKNGTKEILHDRAFAFADQQAYPLDVIVNDGDTLTTTCTYNNTTNGIVTFGPATENEMCYNFTTAWPAGSLASGANNHCMGL
jgi:hypothetical protein